MEVKVLGTVSPWPKGDRNCPAFLVKDDEDNKIMLDCGNGSTRLLDMYKDLTLILSHYHPDHYADFFALANASFIQNKYGYLDEPVSVLLPKETEVLKYDAHTSYLSEVIPDFNFLRNTKHEHFMKFSTFDESSIEIIGDMKITFYKTIHSMNAHAIRIESKNSSLVYSSDTDYDEGLAEFAKCADAFICEATFFRGQVKGSANHLYAYEAGRLARLANVKDLYLYHTFSELDKETYVEESKEEFLNTHSLTEGQVLKLTNERGN